MPNHNKFHGDTFVSTPSAGDGIRDDGTDPENREFMQRFGVSEPTAAMIAAIDNGGIHAGGHLDLDQRDPKFAGVSKLGPNGYAALRDKGGQLNGNHYLLSAVYNSLPSPDQNGVVSTASISPELQKLTEQGNLTPAEARDIAVYFMTAGSEIESTMSTEVITPQNATADSPKLLLGKGVFTPVGSSRRMTLEVATGLDSEGNIIGFTVSSRPTTMNDRSSITAGIR